MSNAEPAPPLESRATEFHTLHWSAGSLHLRTADGVMFIDKAKPDLIERAQQLRRGARIAVTGRSEFSKTLSTYVFALESLDS
jgi:hypothetical protein